MAEIPPTSPAGAPPSVPSPRTPAATGIGEGLAALGAVVSNVGQAAIERNATLAAQRALAEFRSETADALLESKQAAPIGAEGFAAGVLQRFDEGSSARLDSVPVIARVWLEGQMLADRGLLEGQADEFESLSRLEKNRADMQEIVTSSANAVRTDASKLEDSRFLAFDAIDSSGLSARARAIARREANQQITVAYVQGLNETDPDLASEILAGGTIDKVISPQAKNILVNNTQVELRRREATSRAAVAEARSEIRDVIKLLEDGFDPGSETLTRLGGLAAVDKGLSKDLGIALEIYEFQRTARAGTPADLQNWINGERTRLNKLKGVKPGQAARLASAEALLAKMNTGLAKDPLSWAARAGVVQIEPLALVGDGADASIAERRRDATAVAGYYGISPRYLTDEEAAQLTAQLDGMDADGQLSIAAKLAGFGDAAPDVFEDIANKGADLFAHSAGLLLIGAAAPARDILVGAKAMEKGLAPPPLADREAGANAARGAFALSPSTAGIFTRAQTAIYVARAQRRGIGGEGADFDEDLWLRSAQEAAGAVFGNDGRQFGGITDDWNGWPVVVPPDIPIDDFEDVVGKITDEDLEILGATFQDGTAFTAEDLDDAWLVSAGHGIYRVAISDPRQGDVVWLGVAGGTRAFRFDLIALLPDLLSRRPDPTPLDIFK